MSAPNDRRNEMAPFVVIPVLIGVFVGVLVVGALLLSGIR